MTYLGPDSAFLGINRIVSDLTFERSVDPDPDASPVEDCRKSRAWRRGRRRTAWADLVDIAAVQ